MPAAAWLWIPQDIPLDSAAKTVPPKTFNALKKTMEEGTPLDLDAANQIAEAMKNWAISKGFFPYSVKLKIGNSFERRLYPGKQCRERRS